MSEHMRSLIPKELYPTCYTALTFKTTFQNCVLKALQLRQWRQVENNWSLQWSQKERINDVFQEGLSNTQRVNHFRLYTQLCRKDMLIKNIRKFKRQLHKKGAMKEEEWSFLPLTFFLPSQYVMFAEQFRKQGGLWIMKPTSKCQGQGIFLVDKLAQVAPYRQKSTQPPPKPVVIAAKPPVPRQKQEAGKESQEESQEEIVSQPESYLIQQYIARPLLFGSKKFDLRIYALCTNYSALTVWLYRSGFARFTHEPYNTENIDNLQSHLTNVEIQKHSNHYDEIRGGKWLLDKFKHYLLSRYEARRVDACFTGIKDIILRSLQSVQKSILPSKNSFQLYGYDFMIDELLAPWLIEVNGGPSMTANTPFDCQLKCGLIDDALSIIDLEGLLEGNQTTVGGFDLVMDKDVRVKQHPKMEYTSTLGSKNQRKQVMIGLGKRFLERMRKEKSPQVKEMAKQMGKEKLMYGMYGIVKKKQFMMEDRINLKEQLLQLSSEEFTRLGSK